MKDLRGRVAVVTGGANGIGLGLAERFLQEGMKVVIADINEQDLARAEQSLAASGEVLAVTTDVSREDSVQSLADAAVARFGGVHVLCNNAGVGGTQRFDTVGQATWEWTIGVNLWGVVHGCRIFLPILAAQDEAYIVNTASMAASRRVRTRQPTRRRKPVWWPCPSAWRTSSRSSTRTWVSRCCLRRTRPRRYATTNATLLPDTFRVL